MIFNKLFAKQKQETISTQELEELLKILIVKLS